MDPAKADSVLNALFDRIDDLSGPALRDSALAVFNSPGVSDKDKALAAYLAANGHAKLDDPARGCDWARRAVSLDPTQRSYSALVQSICQP